MSQSSNRGGMTSAIGNYSTNKYGNSNGSMVNRHYGSNFQNGQWNGPALNYSNGLLNPQGVIPGLSGWSSNTMNAPQTQQTVDQSWYSTPYAQNPTATPGQTAFPDIDMNTGRFLNSASHASSQAMNQQPAQSGAVSGGSANNGIRVNPAWYSTPYAQNPTATPGQTAFPDIDMNTGRFLKG